MRYELWLSLRYLLARRRERFISVITLLSISGVALGVAVLLVVLALMSGFDHDLKDKLVGVRAHLIVESPRGIQDVEPLLRQIASAEHVVGVSPFVDGQAIVRLPDRAFGVLVRGLDPQREQSVSRLDEYLVGGRLPQENDEAVIGTELSLAIGTGVGDSLRLMSPADGTLHELTVSGIFQSGLYEVDASLVGLTIQRAQQMFLLGETVSGLAVRVDDLDRAPEVKASLWSKLDGMLTVKTWMEFRPALFGALRLEKIMMFLVVTLIIVVAAMNIVSSLIMSVMEKTKDIGVLRSLGATRFSVASLFLYQGCLIGATGIGLGLAGGLLVATNLDAIVRWSERTFGIAIFPPSIYYLDHIPTQVNSVDVTVIVVAAFLLTLLAGVYPAIRAARLVPVEALRIE